MGPMGRERPSSHPNGQLGSHLGGLIPLHKEGQSGDTRLLFNVEMKPTSQPTPARTPKNLGTGTKQDIHKKNTISGPEFWPKSSLGQEFWPDSSLGQEVWPDSLKFRFPSQQKKLVLKGCRKLWGTGGA